MTNKAALLRTDLSRAAYAAAHGVEPRDVSEDDIEDVEDAIDRVLINHGIIDFERHFPHTHAADPEFSQAYCTFTAPTGDMCMEPLAEQPPPLSIPNRGSIECGHPINYQRRWQSGDGVYTFCTTCNLPRLIKAPS